MPDAFADWDKNIRPKLGRVGDCAERIFYYADQIEKAASIIKPVPEFETNAEAQMKLAIKTIERALTALNKRREAKC